MFHGRVTGSVCACSISLLVFQSHIQSLLTFSLTSVAPCLPHSQMYSLPPPSAANTVAGSPSSEEEEEEGGFGDDAFGGVSRAQLGSPKSTVSFGPLPPRLKTPLTYKSLNTTATSKAIKSVGASTNRRQR